MTEVTLTPAELELIKLKREQEALAEKEAALQKAADNEKRVTTEISRMHKDIDKSQAQVKAAWTFARDFGPDWTVKVETHSRRYAVQDYLGYSKYDVHWETNQPLETATIVNGDWHVRVDEHHTSGDSWGRGSKNLGWKMYLSGPGIDYAYARKALSRASTIEEKVKDIKESRRLAEETKRKTATALENIVATMAERYPDASIVTGKSGEYGNSWKRTNWFEYDTVTITFTNGIRIVYRVYPDGSLGRREITFPKMNTAYDLMDVMNAVVINM